MAEAAELFRGAIAEADQLGDPATTALGWNRLGEELLLHGAQREAETALLEAYRLRKMNRLPLDFSYWDLGRLRFGQGDISSASILLDLAVAGTTRNPGLSPRHDIFADRSRVRAAEGRLWDALADARTAVRLARAWRSEPPDDSTRIGSEGRLDAVHQSLVDAGNRIYLQTHDTRLIRETFEAEEENRASSLRALLARRRADMDSRPPEYWEALSRLQRDEVAALREDNRASRDQVSSARRDLERIEAELEPTALPAPGLLLDRVRKTLDSETAILTFNLGQPHSWLWALDRDGIELYALPDRTEVEAQVRRAVDAIRDDTPSAEDASSNLYRTLFGKLSARFTKKRKWLLERDAALFDIPVAALVVARGKGRPVYVADRHITKTIPGAGFRLEAAAQRRGAAPAPLFLGIGDAIYNEADSRLPVRYMKRLFGWLHPERARRSTGEGPAMALPRLAGSGKELEACARVWNGDRRLLTGIEASAQNVAQQLRSRPAVVHFATHVVGAADARDSGLIALSLGERGGPELLSPEQIAAWNVTSDVVVISGCFSSRGSSLPETGLLGLTRAWLTAGAHSVVASHWPTLDENGRLFTDFYRHLKDGYDFDTGEALRAAQLDAIREGGWRARPGYWASYFAMGSD